jgi:pSer/pThr/pTyr-binding forkhead associated (FHA) protein|tara:strand:+ start:137 stop:442 length:306 start_codon:yes stop_codon:yes gene_type:complete
MQVSYQYQGKWHIKSLSEVEVVVGRPNAELHIGIDLSPDTTVSRKHARIWLADELCWIEDLGSRYGTTVNGTRITARQQLQEGDSIGIGETTLRVNASNGK